jgi:hypothetical protein
VDRQRVASRSIRSIGYDPTNRILEVEFNNSGVYRYFDVPSSIHTALLTSPSKGGYVNDHVKDRFDHRKIR